MDTTSRSVTDAPKRATNVSIGEAGLGPAVAEKRAELWRAENLEALQSSNDYVERNGLPLAKYGQ